MGTAAAMIAKASSQVGVREGRNKDGTWNNVQPYGTWYANQINNQSFAAVPWCDIFISWCAAQSGNGDIIPLNAWVPSRLKYYRDLQRTGYFPPSPGDIGIILVNGSPVHVFLVEKWLGNAVQTIEGNTNDTGSPQGNGVYRLKRPDSANGTNIVYCRPAYSAAPPVVVPPPPVKGSDVTTTNDIVNAVWSKVPWAGQVVTEANKYAANSSALNNLGWISYYTKGTNENVASLRAEVAEVKQLLLTLIAAVKP